MRKYELQTHIDWNERLIATCDFAEIFTIGKLKNGENWCKVASCNKLLGLILNLCEYQELFTRDFFLQTFQCYIKIFIYGNSIMELSPLQTKKKSLLCTNKYNRTVYNVYYTCKIPLNSERWNCVIAQCNCVLLTRFRSEHRTTTVGFGLEEITDLKSEFNV